MKQRNDNTGFYAVILFLIWPFLALVSAFRNYRAYWAMNILWAFVAFYGFTFAIGAESETSDIVRYVAEYQEMHRLDMDFNTAVRYYRQSGEIDIVRTAIDIGLSRITDSQPILTLVYAIIFGFFFSRNMWYVLERLEGKIQPIVLVLFACFFLVIPMWQINTFRMWTAAHIFLYGLLPYLCEGKKKGLWIAPMSILVHFAYLVPVGILFGYILFGNLLTIYFCFFLTTLFISEINLSVINNLIENYAPEILQERTASYRVNEMPGEETGSSGPSRVWYARWYGRALKYAVTALLIGLFVTGRKYILQHREWLNLFCYVLLFYGTANLLGSLSSSGRFINLANFFSLPLIILYIQNIPQEKIMTRFTWFASPALLLFIIVAFRIGLYSMSATAILGNPIVAIFTFEETMSLNDFLKSLL